jgi:hypothetical protein
MRSRLEGWYGLDPATLARLDPASRQAIRRAARLGLLPCTLAAAGAAHACHLVLLSWAADLVVALAAALFVWNLLRLSVAGTGIAPHLTPDQGSGWRPGRLPIVLFAYFGFLAGQSLYLWMAAPRLDHEIALYQEQLLAEHRENLRAGPLDPLLLRAYEAVRLARARETRFQVLQAAWSKAGAALAEDPATGSLGSIPALERQRMEAERAELEADMARAGSEAKEARRLHLELNAEASRLENAGQSAFRELLGASAFPARRLRIAWRTPTLPLLVGLLGALLASLPLLDRRRTARAYERERHRVCRLHIEEVGLLTRAEVDRLLGRYRTHRPEHGQRYLDPPFDRSPMPPEPFQAPLLTGRALLDLLPGDAHDG